MSAASRVCVRSCVLAGWRTCEAGVCMKLCQPSLGDAPCVWHLYLRALLLRAMVGMEVQTRRNRGVSEAMTWALVRILYNRLGEG